jgi:Glycosyltransferase like family
MNERKFLFVTCVNDEALYAICVQYIQQLSIPPNFTVERMPIRGAKSMAAGYNLALTNDAKYKIYLHQDTFILNKNFLYDLLHLFSSNPALGLLGTVGCKVLPSSGNWLEAEERVGKLILCHNNHCSLLEFNEISTPFEPVESVDGYLMATQYDIPWREDLFKGFHFYDASQSIEFAKRGYLVGVAKQQEPWSLHYMNHVTNQQEYMYHQRIFLQHYKNRRASR